MNKIIIFIVKILGPILSRCDNLLSQYRTILINEALGGGDRWIAAPNNIQGIENIEAGNHIHINAGATIFSTRAKIILHGHFIAGPNLTIISGDHMSIVGRTMDSIKDNEKNADSDKDIIIEEDVWSGTVVTKKVPPYSIVAMGTRPDC